MSSYLSEASQDHQLPTLSAGRLSEEGPTVAAREYLSTTRATLAAAFHPSKPITPFLRNASDAVLSLIHI